MTTVADAKLAIAKEQRNQALNDFIEVQAQAWALAQALAERDQEIANLKQRVGELETSRETPAPERGSKAHLNEANHDSIERIKAMASKQSLNGTFNGH